mmetsp:Transcript_18915/g.19650  ORF Transcript_18915/g.19650 Transcript_18915/m.19650 type:complete len:154 (+) Transcript_18915:65-526(+)
MICSCQRSTGVVSNIPLLVREKLEVINKIYPSTKYVCVVNREGELIASLMEEETPTSESLIAIATLKSSALQFASTLQQIDCPVLHLTGETYMFSLYEVGDFLLAFYTEIHGGSSFSTLDLTEEEANQMLEVVSDLRLMLQNVIVAQKDNNMV